MVNSTFDRNSILLLIPLVITGPPTPKSLRFICPVMVNPAVGFFVAVTAFPLQITLNTAGFVMPCIVILPARL